MKHHKISFARVLQSCIVSTGLVASAAFAAGPCADDIAKFCPDVKSAGGAIMQCLEKHESELTEACKAHEMKMHGRRGESMEKVQEYAKLRQSCNTEISKYCQDGNPGGVSITDCLTAHSKDLSAGCNDALKATDKKSE